jgi:hypothetical protein
MYKETVMPKAAKSPRKAPGREKLTTTLSAEARHKLSVLKADLRLAGVPTSEGEILDALLVKAEADALARQLRSVK